MAVSGEDFIKRSTQKHISPAISADNPTSITNQLSCLPFSILVIFPSTLPHTTIMTSNGVK